MTPPAAAGAGDAVAVVGYGVVAFLLVIGLLGTFAVLLAGAGEADGACRTGASREFAAPPKKTKGAGPASRTTNARPGAGRGPRVHVDPRRIGGTR